MGNKDEFWKPLFFKNKLRKNYMISNYGNIKNTKSNRLLRIYDNNYGYLYFQISENNKKSTYSCHRAVLESFVRSPRKNEECCHNDGNKKNNYVLNLRWASHKNNCKDQEKHGTKVFGEIHGQSKLKNKDVLRIRKLRKLGVYVFEISRIYNINEKHVREIAKGKYWKHLK